MLDERQQVSQKIAKYTLDSRPKIGWEGENEVNHFQLVREIAANEYGIRKSEILELFSDEKLNACIKMMESEFGGLMSENRISAIQQVLKMRHKKLIEIVTRK